MTGLESVAAARPLGGPRLPRGQDAGLARGDGGRGRVDPLGPARLGFAIGCLAAAARERARAGRAPIAVRLVGLSLGTIFVAQAVVESHQWLNGNEASRRTYLLVVAIVVALLTIDDGSARRTGRSLRRDHAGRRRVRRTRRGGAVGRPRVALTDDAT